MLISYVFAAAVLSTVVSEPSPRQREIIENHPARQDYAKFCAGCHGWQLQGGTAPGISLGCVEARRHAGGHPARHHRWIHPGRHARVRSGLR